MAELRARAERIATLEPSMRELDDDALLHVTADLRARLADEREAVLDEALAAAREAIRREQGFTLFDEQVMGALALVSGEVAESPTGSGKTVIAEAAAYFMSLGGAGVHVVTVNDYLAGRDAELASRTLGRLGVRVGLVLSDMRGPERKAAYGADITYGTNTEFGFDYLRDNMATSVSGRVQRGHGYAIIDEVDSILIDESRTPLIISGQPTESAQTYRDFAYAVRGLAADVDYDVDETQRTIFATDDGLVKIEQRLGISDIYRDSELVNHLRQALRAEYLFHRDRDYVVLDDEVKIVDEFTGRIMEGRRWSEGLHQAIEAKEGVRVQEESQTLATVTLQNYFRLYDTLSGMTGTALTEDSELRQTYGMPVVVIPPHHPNRRVDLDDRVYADMGHKLDAIVEDVVARHAVGQPVLLGTATVESSERISSMLRRRGVRHQVLNAKNHAREAEMIAQAGRLGAVTVATNMAGRGTDILLGGNPEALVDADLRALGVPRESVANLDEILENARAACAAERERVVAAGGLAVIGSERHEARRIDNQLRGRSGRQGDPGCSQFYVSFDDDLLRRFGPGMERVSSMMSRLGVDPTVPIESRSVTRSVERAQGRVEEVNREARKRVLEYDDVLDRQRRVLYEERDHILEDKDLVTRMDAIIEDVARRVTARHCSDSVGSSHFDLEGLGRWLQAATGADEAVSVTGDSEADVCAQVSRVLIGRWEERLSTLGTEVCRSVARDVMLHVMDRRWVSYLQEMDYLREGIGLRGFAQRDPLTEYRQEAWVAFGTLVDDTYEEMLETLLRVEVTIVREAETVAQETEAGGKALLG